MTAHVAEMLAGALERADLERIDGQSDLHPIVDAIRRTAQSERQVRTSRAGVATMDMRLRLQQVLAGQSFPAARWELIAAAEMYGADLVTRSDLRALLPVRFRSLAEVLLAVESTSSVSRCASCGRQAP
jgi:sirohydrochlorin ferrochelatase